MKDKLRDRERASALGGGGGGYSPARESSAQDEWHSKSD